MIRAAVVFIVLVAAFPVEAQTGLSSVAGSAGSGVGSASLRNGYPAGAGAAVLPVLPAPSPAAGGVTVTSATGVVRGAAGGIGGGSSRGAAGAGSGSRGPSARSGGNLVLCPPSDASGEAAFLTGTDLSCAPQ